MKQDLRYYRGVPLETILEEREYLRTQLAEAVALLRHLEGGLVHWETTGLYPINSMRHRLTQARAFLARIDGVNAGKAGA